MLWQGYELWYKISGLGYEKNLQKWSFWKLFIFQYGTNQTSLYIDHAQSSFVSLPFTYPSKIKLLSTQPSCLNVPLTSGLKARISEMRAEIEKVGVAWVL